MKKLILALSIAVAFTASVFAGDTMIDISNVYPIPSNSEETIEEETVNTERTALGFDLSILGFELSYMHLSDHFEVDLNVAYTKYDNLDMGEYVSDIAGEETTIYYNNSTSHLITPKLCMGYNTLPGKKGWTNTFGGFLATPMAFYDNFKSFDLAAAAGFYWRGAKSFNNVIEVGISTFMPFVVGLYTDGAIGIVSVLDGPAMCLGSVYAGVFLGSLDFKFYLN